MSSSDSNITIEHFSEAHIEGISALYSDPAVARQWLQMRYVTVN
ncbi:putative acetyltransferase [Pseudomonas sp. ok272]|nr:MULTISPECIES: hypothetical protein [unclassified Pseudomonas]SEN64407.1 putative acetyltransferase [Pseudomonas sp. ok272]SFN43179.1 putative acetyltransferase [Pseudomonas sp. ok602]